MGTEVGLSTYLSNPNLPDFFRLVEALGPRPRPVQDTLDFYRHFRNQFKAETERWMYFQAKLSHAVPSRQAFDAIAAFTGPHPILEIGAGRGLWAHGLQLSGLTVIPTDAKLGIYTYHYTFAAIEKLTADEALSKYSEGKDVTLFCCWPNYSLDPALLGNVRRVVYVGEVEGCTGCGGLDETLGRDFRLEKTIRIPQWPALRDLLFLYRRR